MPTEDCTHRGRKEAKQGAVGSPGRHRGTDGPNPGAVRSGSAHRARGNGPGGSWGRHRSDAVRQKTTHRDRKGVELGAVSTHERHRDRKRVKQGAVGSHGRHRDTDGANPGAVRGGGAHRTRENGPGAASGSRERPWRNGGWGAVEESAFGGACFVALFAPPPIRSVY